jgi:hypothetical protein
MDQTPIQQPPLIEGRIRFLPANLYVQGLDNESSRDERVSTFRHVLG